MKKVLLAFVVVQAILFSSVFPMRSVSAYTSLKMLNATGRTIFLVYFVPNHYTDWGPDRLNGVWNSGNFLTLKTPKWKYWSLKIVFRDGESHYWDGDSAIDTDNWGALIIKPNGRGGYTLSNQS